MFTTKEWRRIRRVGFRRHFGNNYVFFLRRIYASMRECVKVVAECREDVLLETVAIQDTQDREFFFIRCVYPDET